MVSSQIGGHSTYTAPQYNVCLLTRLSTATPILEAQASIHTGCRCNKHTSLWPYQSAYMGLFLTVLPPPYTSDLLHVVNAVRKETLINSKWHIDNLIMWYNHGHTISKVKSQMGVWRLESSQPWRIRDEAAALQYDLNWERIESV